jgi:uncharacterized lipoprotein YddW (UPF0748 family)
MIKQNLTFAFLLACSVSLFAQNTSPKREFRAAWIAHVSNIDWPSSKTLTADQQRNEFLTLLNEQKLSGFNAVVVQVRPSCDAIYPSPYEPWSEWLTGTQGKSPGYDPLKFMVEETHKRGIEFHAWFNPYRALTNINSTNIDTGHIYRKRPEWVIPYNTIGFLDPGLPDVRSYVTTIIMDVVRRYDIDAVHFDDYFYPYPVTGFTINDNTTFQNHARGFTDKNNWRRDNVDLLIKMVADSIKKAKPYVKFGISPFGIWRNSGSDATGSSTNGLQSYSDIYADSRKWIQQGWLDYIAPQLYWSIGFNAARYEVLVPWWANVVGNRHLYIGQGIYRIASNTTDPNWANPSEMPKQFRLNRSTPSVSGSIHYSAKQVMRNLLGFQDSLRNQIYNRPALIPTMRWIDSIPPLAPTGLAATINSAQTQVTLTWNRPNVAADGGRAAYYVVYRFLKGNTIDLTQTAAIRHITPTDTTSFTDVYANPSAFVYVVTAVDRLHNESAASNSANVGITKTAEQAAFSSRLLPNYPNPFSDMTTVKYEMKQAGKVNIQVFNLNGAQIATLVNEQKAEGVYETEWRVSDIANGTYICTMQVNGLAVSTLRMTIIN